MSIDNQEPDEPEREPDLFITGRVFMTSCGVFIRFFSPRLCATYWLVDGEGAPQRHQGLLAVAADERLLVEDAVMLTLLQHLRPAERRVRLLGSRR